MKLPSDVRKYLAENRVEAVRFNDGIFYSINDDIPELDKPAEPLIKDEKIRKAVRAWAEVLKVDEVEFYGSETWIGFRTKLIGYEWSSKFELDYSGSKNTFVAFKKYTIAELCGEEEE